MKTSLPAIVKKQYNLSMQYNSHEITMILLTKHFRQKTNTVSGMIATISMCVYEIDIYKKKTKQTNKRIDRRST